MWKITTIRNPTSLQLWFSDGGNIDAPRGGYGVTNRLIVEKQGFIDITEFPYHPNIPKFQYVGSDLSMLTIFNVKTPVVPSI